MQREQGYLNENPFIINESWDNGTRTNYTFPRHSALFAEDGRLLSFDLVYDDGFNAPIVLVPKREWLDDGMRFIDKWLAPIGLTFIAGAFAYNATRDKKQSEEDFHFSNLAQFAGSGIGMYGVHFLTKNVRNHNLMYININTKVKYLDHPLQYDPKGIFGN